jgi:hypothetical protein
VTRKRAILEHAVHAVTEQQPRPTISSTEAIAVGHGRSDPPVTHAKMLRLSDAEGPTGQVSTRTTA